MKTQLSLIVFVPLPVTKLRFTVEGSNDINIKALGEKGRSISSFSSIIQLSI